MSNKAASQGKRALHSAKAKHQVLENPHKPTSKAMNRLVHFNEFLEHFIAMVVVVLIFIAALLVLWSSSLDLYRSVMSGDGFDIPYIVKLLSSIMLALVLAEIISTVNAFLKNGIFSPVPFLVVAVIASVRRILLISIENKDLVGSGGEISNALLIELGLLTLTIGVCSWAINMLRSTNLKMFQATNGVPSEADGYE